MFLLKLNHQDHQSTEVSMSYENELYSNLNNSCIFQNMYSKVGSSRLERAHDFMVSSTYVARNISIA